MSTVGIKNGRANSSRAGLSVVNYRGAMIGGGESLAHVGTIIPFAGSTPPKGWLICDGTSNVIYRSLYSELFSAIGTTWGAGDGSTTFNIPDLRGAFLRGTGTNGTHSIYVGPSVGSKSIDIFKNHDHSHGHGTTGSETASHNHEQQVTANPGYGSGTIRADFTSNGTASGSITAQCDSFGLNDNHTHTIDSASPYQSSGNAETETSPFNFGVNYIIKY